MAPYRRKFFIKDLFSPRGLLNSFELIQFESIEDYLTALQKGWVDMGRNQRIIVKVSDDNLENLRMVFTQTGVLSTDKISLDITSLSNLSDVSPFLDLGAPLDLYLDMDQIDSAEEIREFSDKLSRKWFENNRIILNVFVDKNNYKNQLNSIVELFMKTSIRFFKISLDYESLSDLTFKEFEDFKLRIMDLRNWTFDSRFDSIKGLSFVFSSGLKKIVVKDSKMYVNEYALRDGVYICDLEGRDGQNGEDINNKDLAALRSYMELKEYDVRPFSKVEGIRKSLIDPYFNKKMTTSYIFLPPITQLMLTLFN